MRRNYPLISKQINDVILTAYEHYVYLLGYDDENGVTTTSGVYDQLEEEFENYGKEYLIYNNDTTLEVNNTDTPISYNFDKVNYSLNLLRRKTNA